MRRKPPNYYLDKAEKYCGNLSRLSKKSKISIQLLSLKKRRNYKVGDDMFASYCHALQIQMATDCEVMADKLCQKTAAVKTKAEQLKELSND